MAFAKVNNAGGRHSLSVRLEVFLPRASRAGYGGAGEAESRGYEAGHLNNLYHWADHMNVLHN